MHHYSVEICLQVPIEAASAIIAAHKAVKMAMDGTLNESFQRDSFVECVELDDPEDEDSNA